MGGGHRDAVDHALSETVPENRICRIFGQLVVIGIEVHSPLRLSVQPRIGRIIRTVGTMGCACRTVHTGLGRGFGVVACAAVDGKHTVAVAVVQCRHEQRPVVLDRTQTVLGVVLIGVLHTVRAGLAGAVAVGVIGKEGIAIDAVACPGQTVGFVVLIGNSGLLAVLVRSDLCTVAAVIVLIGILAGGLARAHGLAVQRTDSIILKLTDGLFALDNRDFLGDRAGEIVLVFVLRDSPVVSGVVGDLGHSVNAVVGNDRAGIVGTLDLGDIAASVVGVRRGLSVAVDHRRQAVQRVVLIADGRTVGINELAEIAALVIAVTDLLAVGRGDANHSAEFVILIGVLSAEIVHRNTAAFGIVAVENGRCAFLGVILADKRVKRIIVVADG